jgi:hypothetical protein
MEIDPPMKSKIQVIKFLESADRKQEETVFGMKCLHMSQIKLLQWFLPCKKKVK